MEVSGQLQAPAAIPRYPLDETLGGPKAGLDTVEKRQISCPCWESNSDSLAVQPASCRYTDWLCLLY
jgi:hypothetical protein